MYKLNSTIDVTNSRNSKIPISNDAQLENGTQISVIREKDGFRFDHHGVFIGRLDPTSKEAHAKLLTLHPELKNCPCIVDMSKGPNDACVSSGR